MRCKFCGGIKSAYLNLPASALLFDMYFVSNLNEEKSLPLSH